MFVLNFIVLINITFLTKYHTVFTILQQGQTALSIAQKLGYISVVETLKVVTETTITTTTSMTIEEKYKVVAPESMQETFMSDSEDEGGKEVLIFIICLLFNHFNKYDVFFIF